MNNKEILHPGEVLVFELDAKAEDPTTFAIKIGMFPSDFFNLLNGKEPFTPAIARQLEAHLNLPAQFWLELQADYDSMTK